MRLFVENLTNIDFSYLCPARGLIGETWLANIELVGELDQQGMVCDFGIVKKRLREWFDLTLDHCLLVPAACADIETKEQAGLITASLNNDQTQVFCTSPASAITVLDVPEITPALVAGWCVRQLEKVFGNSVSQVQLTFTTESIDGPYYHYSHGLKKHRGNCQRIAHGHRSRIQIWRNGSLCLASMRRWSGVWQDIYVGTASDIVHQDDQMTEFAYQADQGEFFLKIPNHRCYILPSDTTVELLAQHIADTLYAESPTDKIVVKAYEGIGKGAIVALGQ